MTKTLRRSLVFLGLLALAGSVGAAPERARGPAAAEATAASPDAHWKVWGGEVGFRWNTSLIADMGITLVPHGGVANPDKTDARTMLFPVRDASALDFAVWNGNFAGFIGGSLAFRGGYDLRTAKGTAVLRDARLVPRADNRFVLDVVGSDGVAWFSIDRMMYEVEHEKGAPVLRIKAMDLIVAPALADLLGQKTYAGLAVANLWMNTRIHSDSGDPAVFRTKGSSGRWPGDPVPSVPGETYQADVFMHNFTGQYSRRDGAGNAVFTPSSTLRNNRNNGTRVNTFPTLPPFSGGAFDPGPSPGDPDYETRLNASTALYTAHIPWYTKFDDGHAPYNNDQHPYLIWNLYRIDADGDFEQIGRSGVKHAWLTTNSPCDESAPSNHILARGCADTYGVGNNDEITDLGPRSEIIPATGEWGRCNSVYDTNCDGNEDFDAPCQGLTGPAETACEDYAFRMIVRESDIDATNTDAIYWYESWYIVREDINIYNTMQTRPVTLTFGGGTWTMNNSLNTELRLGSAIDRWVDPATTDPNERNTEIDSDGGHAKVAVKVSDLGGGQFRYDYAVMNFDFARAQTVQRANGLEVLSNDGFTAFELPVSQSLTVTDIEFSDGDNNAANDWALAVEANRIVWTAPAGNTLNWGTMFRFSLVANSAPIEAPVSLTTALTSSVEVLTTASLLPQSEAVATFTVGGELAGLAAGQTVTLQLNNGAPLELAADGVFGFTNEVLEGGAYAVTVAIQPATQTCSIANDEGTIAGADVTDVLVTCVDTPYGVGGTVSGLGVGQQISLQLNNDEIVTVDNGSFEFAAGLVAGTAYAVTIVTQPSDRVCSIANGAGEIVDADVSGVQVTCVGIESHSIGGLVSGLVPSASVELQLNGGEILVKSGNGMFEFATAVPEGAAYSVTVALQPAGRNCVVNAGEGAVGEADVTNVMVVCTTLPTYSVGGSISGLPAGSGVTLQLNDTAPVTLTVNGAFNFPSELPEAAAYDVTVVTQPPGRTCIIDNASGTIATADVDDVVVTCARPPTTVFDDGFE